ncbi:hypothetical protein [Polaribacter porphyrae]|uniref:DUF1330 domain-containing protein n=1 Tax=Polaribacter porphyrae TaxID=1137780 RepID=A0A2S7WPS0_9FLAO|nr:hypothetical protein [Polaribacter porphyrae]PQJ79589.1 hypothetical protein BTO18_10580 [Polaribacter porphyrae]
MEINKKGLEILSKFEENKPVFMMNYLNYKDQVSETGKTGKETYNDYMKAATPFFQKIEAEIIFRGKPQVTIIGPFDEKLWDEVLIVKYANKNEFFKLMQFKEYPRELRASALKDSRLIFCK